MISLLLGSSGFVLIGTAWFLWRRYRDPLHPMIYLAPMFFYVHVLVPWILLSRGTLNDFLGSDEKLRFAQFVVSANLIALCLGSLLPRLPHPPDEPLRWNIHISSIALRRLRIAAYLLGSLGLAGFFYRLSTIGGFVAAYSRPKGGGAISGLSGYITGSALLTIPAILLLVLSHRGQRPNWKLVSLMLLFAFPHTAQGLLGGSRGNVFLAIATLTLGWYLARAARPSLRAVLAGLLITAVLMFMLKTHRHQIYLGAEEIHFDWNRAIEAFVPREIEPENVSVLTLGTIIAAHDRQHCFWGKRYLAQLFVRPIPRQLWPTKYQDLGFAWMVDRPGSAGLHPSQWIASVGWFPAAGSAVGLVGDSFLELSWLGVFVSGLVGWFYAWLWRNAVWKHGVWTMLYFEACVVSVYLPTQGLATAWLYRFAYLAVPSLFLWRIFFAKHIRTVLMRPLPPKITDWIVRAMRMDSARSLRNNARQSKKIHP